MGGRVTSGNRSLYEARLFPYRNAESFRKYYDKLLNARVFPNM